MPRSFMALAQFESNVESVAGASGVARVRVASVSREFFDVLGVQPMLGRTFVPNELHMGAAPAALVSYRYWQRYLGSTAELASRSLRIGERLHSIVGVMPRGFAYPDGADIWMPRELWPVLAEREAHNLDAVGRLAANVALEQAREELGVRLRTEPARSVYFGRSRHARVSIACLTIEHPAAAGHR